MKKKLFTCTGSHEEDNLAKLDKENLFTSEERSWISEQELKNTYLSSKDKLLEWSIKENAGLKFAAINEAANRISEKGFKKILSLGSGMSDNEYFLHLGVEKNVEIISSEYDTYAVKKSNEYFPEFKTIKFDLNYDLVTSLNEKFDAVIFFGAAYAMDDKEFIRLFKDIKEAGIKEIMDFHAGYITNIERIKYYLRPTYKFLKNTFSNQKVYQGKFHGFGRTRKELLRLYSAAGWETHKIMINRGIYPFSIILNPKQ